MRTFRSNFALAGTLAALLLLPFVQAHAATHVLAAGGGNWSSAASWASGGVPTSGEMGGTIVQIPGSTTSTDDIAGLVVDLLDFTGSGAILNGGPGVTLGISGIALLTNLQAAGTTQINPSLPIVLSGNNCGVTVTAGTLQIYSAISGNQGLYKLGGTGELTLGHSNSYTGKTIVTIGTLRLTGATPNATIPGDVEVGDGAGAAYSAVLAINSALEQIADTSNVKIYSDGWFLLPAGLPLERFGSLTMIGGLLQADPGNSVAPGNVTATSSATGPATIASNIQIPGGATTVFSVSDGPAADDLVLNGAISESSPNAAFVKGSQGTMKITTTTTACSYTGITIVEGILALAGAVGTPTIAQSTDLRIAANEFSGTLRLLDNGRLSNAATVTVFDRGVFDLNGFDQTIGGMDLRSGAIFAALVTTGAGTLTLGGNLTTTLFGSGATPAQISGKVSLPANRTFTIADGSAVSDLTLNAVVSGPGGIIKDGAGTLTFNAVNTLSGTTTINNGRAIVLGSLNNSGVIVSSGVGVGMLLGTGSVKSIVAAAGGYVSPGTPALTSGPNVQLLADSFFTVSIAGAGVNDKLAATGNVSLAGNLNVSLNYAPAVGTVFTIIDATGGSGTITGTFAGVPEGDILGFGAYKLQIHYDTKSVTLTAVCGMPDSTTPTVTAPAAATVTQTTCQ